MDKRIFREEHTFTITINKKILFVPVKKQIVLRYKQASVYELFAFISYLEKGDDVWYWFLDFCAKYADKKITNSDKPYLYMNFHTIFNYIKSTYFYGCFDETSKKRVGGEQTPFDSYICYISEIIGIDPITLMKTYTIQQLEFLTHGIVWNKNEMTKEGKKKNRLRMIAEKKNAHDKEKLDAIFERIRKRESERKDLYSNKTQEGVK